MKRDPLSRSLVAALLIGAAALAIGGAFGLPVWKEYALSRRETAALMQERGERQNDERFLAHLGRRLNGEGRFAEALPLWERAVGLAPGRAAYRDEWAKAQMGSGRVTAAYGQLREFAAARPDDAEPPFLLGKFYITQQSYSQARTELEKAVRRDASNGEAWSLLAHCRIKMGDYGGAAEALKKAVALRPKSPEDHLQLGVLYSAKNPAEAEKEFALALAQGPENAEIRREYSRFLLSQGKAEPAEKAAREAVERDSSDPYSHLLLGRSLLELRRPQEAIPALLTAASLAPADPTPAESLRRAYRQVSDRVGADLWDKRFAALRDEAEARRKWEQETLAHPGNRTAHENYAAALCKMGEVNLCARQFSLAYKTTPDNPRVLVATARGLNAGGFAQEALPLVRKARALTPTNPEAYEVLGDTLVSLGRLHEAALNYNQIRDWKAERMPVYRAKIAAKAAELAKSDAPAEVALRAAQDAENPADAEKSLNAALAADPQNARALRQLLRLQVGQGRAQEANQTARRLIALAPEDGLGHTLFALLFLQETKDRPLTDAEADAVRQHLRLSEPDDSIAGTLYYTRGLLALRTGKPQEAVADLDRAQKIDPNAVAVYPRLAEARKATGDLAGAERALSEFRRRTMQ